MSLKRALWTQGVLAVGDIASSRSFLWTRVSPDTEGPGHSETISGPGLASFLPKVTRDSSRWAEHNADSQPEGVRSELRAAVSPLHGCHGVCSEAPVIPAGTAQPARSGVQDVPTDARHRPSGFARARCNLGPLSEPRMQGFSEWPLLGSPWVPVLLWKCCRRKDRPSPTVDVPVSRNRPKGGE